MIIGGLQKLTLIDFPGRLAATVFLWGCNFKCPWCYNPELVLPKKIRPVISEKDFFKFLKKRRGLLEGVVLSGGEPTLNKDLLNFCKKIKKLGYLIKLDSNGSNPKLLKKLIDQKLIDYLALDIKAPPYKYSKLCGKKINLKNIERSIEILKKSKIDYEFRTTIVPGLLNKKDILILASWISPAKKYFLQNFQKEKTVDPKFQKAKPYSEKYLLEIQKGISSLFEICQIR
jgi:pyruvate formate lyase activating enzyme